MDVDIPNLFDFELPHVAKSLCEEAIDLAEILGEGFDEEYLQQKSTELFSFVIQQMLSDGIEKLESAKFDTYNLYDYPSDIEDAEEYLEGIGAVEDGSNPQFFDFLNNCFIENEESSNAMLSIALRFMVYSLKQSEDIFLQDLEITDYKETMAYFDTSIHQLTQLMSFAKTAKPAEEYLKTKITRKQGAKKGGVAKSKITIDLREHVLEKAKDNYSDLTPTEAGRRLHQDLDESWLNKEDGTPHFKNFDRTFASWITADRNT